MPTVALEPATALNLLQDQGAACKTDSDCGPPTRGSISGWGPPVCLHADQPGVVFPGCQAAVWPEIPAGLDAISMDIYFQFPERLANGSYFGGGWTEVAWAKAFYAKYFLPLLKPHQSVWLVPGENHILPMPIICACEPG